MENTYKLDIDFKALNKQKAILLNMMEDLVPSR